MRVAPLPTASLSVASSLIRFVLAQWSGRLILVGLPSAKIKADVTEAACLPA